LKSVRIMGSDEKKSVTDSLPFALESDSGPENACFVCALLLAIFIFLIGGNLSIINPEAAIANILLMGLPALILAVLYVGLQIRKIVIKELKD
jgi:hypothetical protein